MNNGSLEAERRARAERDHWQQRALAAEARQRELEERLAEWQQGRRTAELRRRIRWLEDQLVRQKLRTERARRQQATPTDPENEELPRDALG